MEKHKFLKINAPTHHTFPKPLSHPTLAVGPRASSIFNLLPIATNI